MKRLIVLLAVLAMASVSFATDIPAINPQLSLDGNTVTMKADIAGSSIQPEIKVLWYGDGASLTNISETATIQPQHDWIMQTGKNKTTMQAMYADGWKLINMIPYSSTAAKQFFLIFQK
jgi:hypothetical protein